MCCLKHPEHHARNRTSLAGLEQDLLFFGPPYIMSHVSKPNKCLDIRCVRATDERTDEYTEVLERNLNPVLCEPCLKGIISSLNSACNMASKFCITITFVLVWLYAGEVVHTNLRSSVLSLCEFMSRVGSFLAPFLVYLVSGKST